ncbi:MAG: glucose-6-phosphate isomerase [Halioglobus sp.]|nr:glucose-6-phosphate isomerase [Halioglobus sp.]
MSAFNPLTEYPAYAQLQSHAQRLQSVAIQSMLAEDAARADDFGIEAAGIHLDYAKQLLDRPTLALLLELGEQAGLAARVEHLFDGESINVTEQRPALHMLLRADAAGGHESAYAEVSATRERMRELADSLNAGDWQGYWGDVITDVVNIGIGGSDLGPRLVTEALPAFAGALRCHYVANVDPADLAGTLAGLNPATTLFIICSKSFRTEETLTNGLAARQWLLDAGAAAADLDRHFLAVTTNLPAAADFGISGDNCLPMWDWVGGRYSVWSAVGLSSAVALGWENFSRLLTGARRMDEHFRNAAPAANMPMLMALLEVWNCNLLGAENHAVLPYDHSLRQLPDYLQQLTMESNGKRVGTNGEPLKYHTAPVLWGSAGTIGQHSFHQLLHQGTRRCPVDFVLPLNTLTGRHEQHRRLVANCLAQSRALMVGRSPEQAREALTGRGVDAAQAAVLAQHLAMPGNHPHSVLTMHSLTPEALGSVLALYEHRTYCSGQLWGINPFDQWGVELGKEIGAQILQRLNGEDGVAMDDATERLITAWQRAR